MTIIRWPRSERDLWGAATLRCRGVTMSQVTLAPVRIFLAAMAVYDLDDEHCDVVKAFTQNDVTDATLYVSQPPYLPPVLDNRGKPMVMRVVKALEGFKQSGHISIRPITRTRSPTTM